jgi:aminocarboxymuconate-semialdehyde decarboxylase
MMLHRCGHTGRVSASVTEARGAGAIARRGKGSLTVDVHAHAFVPEVEQLVAGRPEKLAEPEQQRRLVGDASYEQNLRRMLPAAAPKLTSVEQRLKDMDAMGIDVQLVSPTSTQHYYWAEPDLARAIVRTTNERIAEVCARYPDRLVALGNIALQHPELASEQLTYCLHTLGMKGVEISSSVNGRELDDPLFETFWAKAEELGALVFLHPFGTSLGERVNRFYLQNVIGQPIETTIALSHLIFGGVLDRHLGLKLLAAHGGGYLPSYIGRANHAWQARPDSHTMQHAPAEYLKRIYFDTLVYEPEGLRHLISEVGTGQIMAGTDYPFDMGSYDPHGLLAAVPGLSDGERHAILGGNALRLLGLQRTVERA